MVVSDFISRRNIVDAAGVDEYIAAKGFDDDDPEGAKNWVKACKKAMHNRGYTLSPTIKKVAAARNAVVRMLEKESE